MRRPLCALRFICREASVLTGSCRERLRDQNALSEEIVTAITGATITDPVEDLELEEELDQLQQEQLDEAILKMGNVPVADAVHKMPTAPANAEREWQSERERVRADGRKPAVSSKKVAEEDDDEEAELRKLQAEMAM